MPKAKVVSFINYKGGVGKTTTTYHVGCSLAQHHAKRVLLVDIDPQTNLTFLCAPVEDWQRVQSRHRTIADLYRRFQDKLPPDTKRYVWSSPIRIGRTRLPNLDLIPCDVNLLGEDLGGGQVSGTFRPLQDLKRQAHHFVRERSFLRGALREVEENYDYILIDCPPNLYLMTQNALAASERYVVTAIPDHLSTIGLSILMDKVEKIGGQIAAAAGASGERSAPLTVARLGGVIFVKVRIGGTLITNTHSSTISSVRKLISDRMGHDLCFSQFTTELIGYGEAAEHSLPVWEHDSENARRAARKFEYQEIANELIARL